MSERTPVVPSACNGSEPGITRDESRLEGNRLSGIFEHAPVSFWEEDFSEIKRSFESLKSKGVEDLRRHFRKHPDEVLSLARMVKVVRVNEATLRLFEARGPEDLREGLSLIFSNESYDVFKEELVAFWRGKTLFRSEGTNLTLAGDSRDILIQVAIPPGFEDSWSRVYVAITDVTSLKEGIRDLRASEDKHRKVFAVSPAPVMLVDHESRVVVEANESVGRFVGLANSAIVGRHFAELFSPECRDQARAVLRGHGKEGGFSAGVLHLRHGSGQSVPVSPAGTSMEVGGTRLLCVSLKEAERAEPSPAAVRKERSLARQRLLKRIPEREREIIRPIAAGQTNRTISEQLHISQKTVETHRSRIMQKFDIHRLADLVRFAVASGLSPRAPTSPYRGIRVWARSSGSSRRSIPHIQTTPYKQRRIKLQASPH